MMVYEKKLKKIIKNSIINQKKDKIYRKNYIAVKF